MKLILFDIDGTILWTDGAGRRAMEASLLDHFGTIGPSTYRYDGKTDAQIVRELMVAAGVDSAKINANMQSVLSSYEQRLEGELQRSPASLKLLDGVVQLLDALDAHAERAVGLLTGNIVGGAERKLRAVGIDPARFVLGAFGSDHEDRHALPAIALERSAAHFPQPVPGSRAFIVGDTPNDIHCGRGAGVRAIAVATGHYSTEQLAEHAPLAVFPDLSDTTAVLRVIDDA